VRLRNTRRTNTKYSVIPETLTNNRDTDDRVLETQARSGGGKDLKRPRDKKVFKSRSTAFQSSIFLSFFFFFFFFDLMSMIFFFYYVFSSITFPMLSQESPTPSPHPTPLPTHSHFLALAFPCTGAYKVCLTNGPLFPVMAD
jgi:hypothetical protein